MEFSGKSRKSPPSVLTLSEPFDICVELAGSETGTGKSPESFIRWLAAPIPDVSVDWCVENLLTDCERSDYVKKFSNEDARFDWLLGRLCAKETVRELVFNLHDILIPSNEIEIRTAEDGGPHVFFVDMSVDQNLTALASSIRISITHSAKRAYVLSINTDGKAHPGIDCEKLRDVEPGMTELVFESDERKFIDEQSTDSKKSDAFLRLWTAREAVLKALNSTAKKPFELVDVHDDRFNISVSSRPSDDVVASVTHEGYAVAICVL